MKKTQENQNPEEILDYRIERVQQNREWKRSLFEMLIFLAAVYVVLSYVIGIALVHGDSMYPNLKENEVLLFYRLDKQYYPGDVVVIHMAEQTEYVKRVVAVEGDTVDLEKETGRLLINEEPLEEPYIYTETHAVIDGVEFPLEVGKNQVFVLGDNRESSKDSRSFGCIPVSKITGRVLLHGGHMF